MHTLFVFWSVVSVFAGIILSFFAGFCLDALGKIPTWVSTSLVVLVVVFIVSGSLACLV